mgnify:FL=1
MQYVVVVCFIRAACLVVIISAAGIKGEFVGSIESEFLIDSICIESCRSYFPGFFQFMSFGVLFVWIQLPSLGLLTAVRGVGAELAGMGFIIEKSFQHGGDYLRNAGIRIESLAIIDSLDNCEIKIR